MDNKLSIWKWRIPKIKDVIIIPAVLFLNNPIHIFCKIPLKNNSSPSAGITANKIIGTLTDSSMDQRIIKLIALGKVKFTRMGEIATGEKAIYDLEKDIIVIKGNVSLQKDKNIMVGESLIINISTGLSKLSGADNKVKMKYNTKNWILNETIK